MKPSADRSTKALGSESPALAERLADELQAQVASGKLPLGGWLRQDHLASELGVSRTPIREALRLLSARGVVEVLPHRGARVRLPRLREIREAYVVRADLEGLAAQLAADLATQDQLDRLRDAEQLFEDAVAAFARAPRQTDGDGAAWGSWHTANDLFHEVIQDASCNRLLRATIANLHRTFPRNLTWSMLNDLRLLQDNVAQHRAIREAVEGRDGAEARRLMVAHITRSGELIATRLRADDERVAE